jgi:aspartate/methionine/tyrosine aminotransferase
MPSPAIATLALAQPEPYIATMNRRTEELAAAGRPVLKLSGGDPRHVPSALRAVLAELAADPGSERVFSYSPILGFESLRRHLARFVGERYGREVGIDQIMVCAGGCAGLYLALKTIVDPGDAVLISDPCWEYLPRLVEQCGARPMRLPSLLEHAAEGRAAAFVAAVAQGLAAGGVRAVVVNSPLNPTGDVLSGADFEQLARLCAEHGAWLVSDEVTIDFQYGGRTVDASALDGFDNVVSVQSFSKNIGLTGFRLGYVIAPAAFIAQLAKTQLYTAMYPCSLVQEAVQRYLALGSAETQGFLAGCVASFEARAQAFVDLLQAVPGVEVVLPAGGLFLFPRVRGSTAQDWVSALDSHAVAVSPGAAFGSACDDRIRLFIGVEPAQMARCAEFLRDFVPHLSSQRQAQRASHQALHAA